MRDVVFNIYNHLPYGYLRSATKNIISFLLSRQNKVETINFDGVKYKMYSNPYFSNHKLANDIKGYNRSYRLRKDDIIVDAGAYNGFFTIYAALKVGPNGQVIALEPDPYSAHILSKNIYINHLSNVVVIKKGLFSRTSRVKFDIQGVSSRLQIYNRNIPTLNYIEVDTLDNILTDLKIKKVNFIKMDIEGAEIEALKGCSGTIKNNPNIHLAIASYHMVHGERTSYALERLFNSFGLRSETKYPSHFTTYAGKNS